jgi:AraC-like DNA-binding protein
VIEPTFQQIARLPVISFYEDAFRKATGVPLLVVAPGAPAQRLVMGRCENEFCSLSAGTAAGRGSCAEVQTRALGGVAHQSGAEAGDLLCRANGRRGPGGRTREASGDSDERPGVSAAADRSATSKSCSTTSAPDRTASWASRLRKAYFNTPVVNAERFEAIVQLLTVFSKYLADFIDQHAMAVSEQEPLAVGNAKRYVQENVDKPIALAQVVEHVGLSRFYFCKMFKKATGMTMTEYVTRLRLEKAKTLLGDPTLRISEVVYASGFGSIPRFNSVFKMHMGMAPTAYRVSLRSQAS